MVEPLLIPYGKHHLALTLPDDYPVTVIAPQDVPAALDPLAAVARALDEPVGGVSLADFAGVTLAAVAISDKTRPVPHEFLLPPLLARLQDLGLPPEVITLLIASGSHAPMPPQEFGRVVPGSVTGYPVFSHDCDDENLAYLGHTARGTPVWANRRFVEADLRIVVGSLAPHQFMGFSGGVKGAAIGLAGRQTITRNHALLTDPGARLGEYDGNPARQDVEAIGHMMGVHFALNAILNRDRQIAAVLAGEPVAVMRAGIPQARKIGQVAVDGLFDLVIASPGGAPKDLNIYQAQKALGHAALITKPGGWLILAAACNEGTGSATYERWLAEHQPTSHADVIAQFTREEFRIGAHKAFQISRDAVNRQVRLVSELPPDFVRKLLLTPAESLQAAVVEALAALPPDARIAVMPQANTTVPVLAQPV
ncbi:MAG: nickel-dependent lactate racemase [Anaerolineae bacterium]|nr:nickel-dependent lactate racemase [Anaerolineae bacterium]